LYSELIENKNLSQRYHPHKRDIFATLESLLSASSSEDYDGLQSVFNFACQSEDHAVLSHAKISFYTLQRSPHLPGSDWSVEILKQIRRLASLKCSPQHNSERVNALHNFVSLCWHHGSKKSEIACCEQIMDALTDSELSCHDLYSLATRHFCN
jgi:hypothetical protein